MPSEGLYESTPRPDLNPCPFCGSTHLELCNLVDERDFYVHCEDCGVQQIADHTEAEAILLWNKRAQHDYEANQGAALFDAMLCLYYFATLVATEGDEVSRRCDELTERSVGAMAIAEGDDGWEKVPIDCPMLAAVAKLKRERDTFSMMLYGGKIV